MKFTKLFATFSAVAVAATGIASIQASAADEFTAYLAGQMGGNECWNVGDVPAGSTTATVNGDAQYEVSWTVSSATGTVEFLMINIPQLSNFNYTDLNITIDSVSVDGTEIAHTQSAGATDYAYCDNDIPDGSTRVYLYNTWVGTHVQDIDTNTTINTEISVVFTVSGMGVAGTSNIVADEPEVTTTTAAPAVTTTAADNNTDTVTTTTAAAGNDNTGTTTVAGNDTTTTAAGNNATTTTTAAAGNSATGVEGVASVVALFTIAGAAVVISKKH